MFERKRTTVKKFFALGAVALIACSTVFAAPDEKNAGEGAAEGRILPLKIYGSDKFPVRFRAAVPPSAQTRYPGYRPENTLLQAGTVRFAGAKPLPRDIMLERDVPIRLRDGVVIFADVFRPLASGRYPALLCLGIGGKEIGARSLDDFQDRLGISRDATSGLECFNGLDPAYWVLHGYAVVNVDPRGVCSSNGDISYFGRQLGEDGSDVVEWIAIQPWCSGRVAMAGCGELAATQWFVAAEQPPHLEAIAPWGGFSDLYREILCFGGIPRLDYALGNAALIAGKNLTEDLAQMIRTYPYMNRYWEDKAARLEEITVPVYVAENFGWGKFGAFDAFRRIAGSERWLRVLTMPVESGIYDPDLVDDLRHFFDYYLKDADNGWSTMSPVRLAVYDPANENFIPRDEEEFPLDRTQNSCLYLDIKGGALSASKPKNYASRKNDDKNTSAQFMYRFDRDTELTGFMALHLWVASESDDADIAVKIERLDRDALFSTPIASGKIRASRRAPDENLSIPARPVPSGRRRQRLAPGMPVSLEIAIDPVSTIFREGEILRLTVLPYEPEASDAKFGSAKIEIPRDSFTYAPGSEIPLQTLTAPTPEKEKAPAEEKSLALTIYAGGEYDSSLLIPVIPDRE